MLKLFKVCLLLGVVGLIGWASWIMFRPPEGVITELRTAEEFQSLITMRNLGLGYLENKQFDAAIAEFETLLTALPDEQLPARNLAIAQTLKIVDKDSKLNPNDQPQEFVDAVRAAQKSIAALQKWDGIEDEIIGGELALHLQDNPVDGIESERAIDLFSRASDLESERNARSDPALDYKVYLAGIQSDDPREKAIAQESVQKAYSFAKDNLWLMRMCLLVQSETSDALMKKTLTQAETSLAPYAGRFQKLHNIDIIKVVKDAQRRPMLPMANKGTSRNDPTTGGRNLQRLAQHN